MLFETPGPEAPESPEGPAEPAEPGGGDQGGGQEAG